MQTTLTFQWSLQAALLHTFSLPLMYPYRKFPKSDKSFNDFVIFDLILVPSNIQYTSPVPSTSITTCTFIKVSSPANIRREKFRRKNITGKKHRGKISTKEMSEILHGSCNYLWIPKDGSRYVSLQWRTMENSENLGHKRSQCFCPDFFLFQCVDVWNRHRNEWWNPMSIFQFQFQSFLI